MSIMLRAAALALFAIAPWSGASAQNYPTRLVHVIAPYGPGGPSDVLSRIIAQKLSEALKQSFVVDNRGGANGIIGTDAAAKAAPDGYTLLVDILAGHAINATLQPKMPFDSLRDFAHISLLAWVPDAIVSLPSLPAKNVQEFIALAKAQPGKLTYASFGVGSSAHMAGELFKIMAGVDILHVPYKGGGPAITDLLAGQVSVYIPVLPSVVPHVKAGRLQLLAVTGAQRSSAMPDVPTVAESGLPGFEASNWYGLMAPAGTPPEIIARLNAESQGQLAGPGSAQEARRPRLRDQDQHAADSPACSGARPRSGRRSPRPPASRSTEHDRSKSTEHVARMSGATCGSAQSRITLRSIRATRMLAFAHPGSLSFLRPQFAAQGGEQALARGRIVVARRCCTPHRVRPGPIAAAPRDDMDVELRHHIAERGDVELVAWRHRLQGAGHNRDLRGEPRIDRIPTGR